MSSPRIPALRYLGRSEGPHAAQVQRQVREGAKRPPNRAALQAQAQRIAAARNIAAALGPEGPPQISPTAAPRMLIDGLSLHQQRHAHTVYDRIRAQGIGPALVHRKRTRR